MTPISAIKGFFSTLTGGGGAVSSDAPTGQICVVDGSSLAGGRDAGRLSPRLQIEILKSLSRFCEREDIPVHVFFPSDPLKVVGDNEDFRGITAYFLEAGKSLVDGVHAILSKAGRKSAVVLVTQAPELEAAFGKAGYTLLRPSTFRKCLDGLPGGDRGDRGDRSERGDRGGRGDRNRRGRDRGGERGGGDRGGERADRGDAADRSSEPGTGTESSESSSGQAPEGEDGRAGRPRRRRRRGRRPGAGEGGDGQNRAPDSGETGERERSRDNPGRSSPSSGVDHLIDVVE
jgi:hypothetical protein